MSIILPNLNHSFISPVPVPVRVPVPVPVPVPDPDPDPDFLVFHRPFSYRIAYLTIVSMYNPMTLNN